MTVATPTGGKVSTSIPTLAEETRRICEIPTCSSVAAEYVEWYNRTYCFGDFRFHDGQVDAIASFLAFQGNLAGIPVGGGKSLIALACAKWSGGDRTVLICPTNLVEKLRHRDVPMAREGFGFDLPVYDCLEWPSRSRVTMGQRRLPGVYLVPSSLLSRDRGEELLFAIQPDTVVIDEAQHFKHYRSGRTKQLAAYIDQAQPKVVAMSGTLTTKSLMEYAHLSRWCFGTGSPLPIYLQHVKDWAGVVDVGQEEGLPDPTVTVVLLDLLRWSMQYFQPATDLPLQRRIRQAVAFRLSSAPGVVVRDGIDLGIEAHVRQIRIPMPPQIRESMEKIDCLIAPTELPIPYALHKYRWHSQVTCGFYTERKPPPTMDPSLEDLFWEREATRNAFQARVGSFLQAQKRLKFPMQVSREAMTHPERLPEDLVDLHAELHDLRFRDLPDAVSIPTRMDPFRILQAVEWAKQGRGIIWYYHREVAQWLVEHLNEAGVNFGFYPATKEANEKLSRGGDDVFGRVAVCSFAAHCTGKDLQGFDRMLFLELPRQAANIEQAFGRIYRFGQQSDSVSAETFVSDPEESSWDSHNLTCIAYGLVYMDDAMTRPTLLGARWDPPPERVNVSTLRARGFELPEETEEQKQKLEKWIDKQKRQKR
jgi:hypothetical protein